MMDNLYNQAKLEILDAVDTLGEVTAREIAVITNSTPRCASMNLFRYHRQGLLNRRTLKGRTKVYTLTERGRERLEWLSTELSEGSG